MSWKKLDSQMAQYQRHLVRDVQLDIGTAAALATSVAADVRFLSREQKDGLKKVTPVRLNDRLEEVHAFQRFSDFANLLPAGQLPQVTRAHVSYQNYICFCYLSEALFLHLRKVAKTGSAAKKCSKFLTDGSVRYFRNAFAHGNWQYSKDFSQIIFWSRKGADKSEPMQKFHVTNEELAFWQALSRCLAYAAFENL